MKSSKKLKTQALSIKTDWTDGARAYLENIKCPGLTAGAGEIHQLAEELPKKLAVLSYKKSATLLWVVFVGERIAGAHPEKRNGFRSDKCESMEESYECLFALEHCIIDSELLDGDDCLG